jgi:LPS-assembly lipoprotein
MWSRDVPWTFRALTRAGAAMLLAGLVAGCFQPMYGERSLVPGSSSLRGALAAVDVAEIGATPGTATARLAVEMRNELNYALTGGTSRLAPTHRLDINLTTHSQQLIVDPTTARGEFEVVAMNVTYVLTEISTSKRVLDGAATARTSFDIPGQQQRYAAIRGQRDAQSRAAKVIAEQIRNRLASHFAAGS